MQSGASLPLSQWCNVVTQLMDGCYPTSFTRMAEPVKTGMWRWM